MQNNKNQQNFETQIQFTNWYFQVPLESFVRVEMKIHSNIFQLVNLKINSQNESNVNKFKFKYRSTFGTRYSTVSACEFFLVFILQYLVQVRTTEINNRKKKRKNSWKTLTRKILNIYSFNLFVRNSFEYLLELKTFSNEKMLFFFQKSEFVYLAV